jgi:hypothetical protein
MKAKRKVATSFEEAYPNITHFIEAIGYMVAPQLTVVTDTTSQSGVAAHASGARAAWGVSSVVVAQDTTAAPGRSRHGR